jgi:hypothetical protein
VPRRSDDPSRQRFAFGRCPPNGRYTVTPRPWSGIRESGNRGIGADDHALGIELIAEHSRAAIEGLTRATDAGDGRRRRQTETGSGLTALFRRSASRFRFPLPGSSISPAAAPRSDRRQSPSQTASSLPRPPASNTVIPRKLTGSVGDTPKGDFAPRA